MLETPEVKKNHNKKSGTFLSRLKTKFDAIIEDITTKVNTETEINDDDEWDDDFDEKIPVQYQTSIPTEPTEPTEPIADFDHDFNMNQQTPPKNQSHNKPKKRKTKSSIWKYIIFLILCTFLILFLCILFLDTGLFKESSPRRLSIAAPKNKYQLSPGEAKLDKPLIGASDNDPALKASDELSNIDFDFSPIMSNKIARTPILPEKVKKSDTISTSMEFQDIWDNGERKQEDSADDTKTSVEQYLPPWRRFAVDYPPTEGLPVFSILLEYDPEILNINNLPKNGGYNVIIPAFLEYSEPLLQALRQKKYEVLMYLPMDESFGPFSFKPIIKNSSFDDIRDTIAFHTSQLGGDGFIGFINYGGSIVRGSLSEMNFTMSLLSKTGYLYIDNASGDEKSLAFAAAEGQKVPSLRAKTYINSVSDDFPDFIRQVKLDGTGIAIVKATPENILALENFEPALKNEQVRRIPVSGILKHQLLSQDE